MAFIPRTAPGLQNPLTEDILCADKAVLDASEVETETLKLTGLTLESQQYVLGYNPLSGEVTYYDPPDGTLVGIAAGDGITITGAVPTPQINLETLGMPTTAYWPTEIEVDEYGRVIDVVTGSRPITSIQGTTNQITASTTLGDTTVGLAEIGSAATFAYPQSLVTDAFGRVTSVTAGSAPTTYTAGTGLSLTGSEFANTGVLSVSAGSGINVGGTAQNPTVGLPSVGVANTYAYPQSLITDTYGRVTSVTSGSAPTTYTAGTGLSLTGSQFANTGILSVSGTSGEVNASTSSGATTVSLPNVGAANTYAYPASITTDTKGRITTITAGTQPLTSLSAGSGISVSGNQITNTGILALTQGNGITITGTNANKTIALPSIGTAATYVYPQSLVTDAFGRVTSITAGSAPTTYTAGTGLSLVGNQFANTGILSISGSGNRVTASTSGGTTTLDLGSIRTAVSNQRPGLLSVDVYGRVTASSSQPFSNNIYTTNQSNLSAPANARSLQLTLVGGGGGGSGASAAWGGSQWFAGHGGGGGSGYRLTKTFNFSSSCVINSIVIGAGGAAGSQPASGPPAGDGGPGGDGGATRITLTIDGIQQTYIVQGGKGGQDTSASGQNDDGANGGAGYGGGGGGCTNGYAGAGATYGSGGAGDLANGGENGGNGQYQSFGGVNLPGGSGGMNYTYWPYNDQKWSYVEPTILGVASGAGAGGGPYGGFVSVTQTGGSLNITNEAPRSGYGGGGGGGCYVNMGSLDNIAPTAGAGGQVQVTFF